jgi:hypothetical protein
VSRRVAGAAACCAALLAIGVPSADAQPPAVCRDVLTARGVPDARQGSDPCNTLGVMIATTAPSVRAAADAILAPDAVPVGAIFSPRDLQARHPQQPSLAGTSAQGHAIPGVQPAGVAAGTIAAVGTDAGNDALIGLGLNPATLFLREEVTRQLARYSRFLDVTMFVPVSGLTDEDANPEDTAPRYYGLRVRLNLHGLAAGSSVWEGARDLIRNWISRAGRNTERVQQALALAPDAAGCAAALLDGELPAAIAAACGRPVALDVDLEEAGRLRAELAAVRRAADSRYFGADIRIDAGDPTMGAEEDAAGNVLFAGLSYGRRAGSGEMGGSRYGFRARLGVRRARLNSEDATELAVEGGFGVELARAIDAREVNASVALDLRHGNAPAHLTDRFETDFVMIRGSFLLPITPGYSLSLNVGAPVSGDVSPMLSVNFNWGLMLPDRLALR